jgi:hypothetical protein
VNSDPMRFCSVFRSNDAREPGVPAAGRSAPLRTVIMALATFATVMLRTGPARAQIAFDDVTTAAGFSHFGVSWGAAWGDYDGDGRPDLWVGNHNHGPQSLYHNVDGQHFVDVSATVLVGRRTGDRHGAEWADFDNDGTEDLMSVEGNSLGFVGPPNQLYVNQGGLLTDEATTLGVAYPNPNPFSAEGGNMTPLWFDFNNDGKLDLLISNNKPASFGVPSIVLKQENGTFVDVSSSVGFKLYGASDYAQITALGFTGTPVVIDGSAAYPDHAWAYNTLPFQDLTTSLGLASRAQRARDTAIADFNGDGSLDIFEVRHPDGSDMVAGSTGLIATLQPDANEVGLSFQGTGTIRMRTGPPNFVLPTAMHLGAKGVQPKATPDPPQPNQISWVMPLDDTDPNSAGMPTFVPGTDFGLYFGHDSSTPPVWTVMFSDSTFDTLNVQISAASGITNATPINFTPNTSYQTPILRELTTKGYVTAPAVGVLATTMGCDSVGAGDFDNDGWVDLYLVCNRRVENTPNILLRNLGNGTFQPVPNAGGAAGSTEGRGDSVAVADYDGDGCLDLFVTNGRGDAFLNVGPDQLFHNHCNYGNHWLEIDLEGTVSNRDAIGARVELVAGGRAQVQLQDGGIHRSTQNFKRLHFGLGSNTTISDLKIAWPAGGIQELTNISADQIITITEPPAYASTPRWVQRVMKSLSGF